MKMLKIGKWKIAPVIEKDDDRLIVILKVPYDYGWYRSKDTLHLLKPYEDITFGLRVGASKSCKLTYAYIKALDDKQNIYYEDYFDYTLELFKNNDCTTTIPCRKLSDVEYGFSNFEEPIDIVDFI